MPALDVPTLLLATALVVAVVGLMLTMATERSISAHAFTLWGASMLVGAGGLSLLATGGAAGSWEDIAGSALVVGGTGLSWSAARCFSRQDAIPGLVLLGPAVYLASAIGRGPADHIGGAVALFSGGIYTLGAGYELWRSRRTAMRSRDAAMVLLCVHGILHLSRGVTLFFSGVWPALASAAVTALLMLEALLHTVAMAFLLLAMMKEERQAEVMEEARRLALVDGLTGLGNRRLFDQTIERECVRAGREGCNISLLMVDVDHFKTINDLQGHQVGDECLRVLGMAIRSALHRPADLVCRFGGEEFAVLMPDTDEQGAERVAGVIHEAVADLKLKHPDSPSGFVTVSIGIATLEPGRLSGRPTGLIRAADMALYAAKSLGRNRTEVLNEPGATMVRL